MSSTIQSVFVPEVQSYSVQSPDGLSEHHPRASPLAHPTAERYVPRLASSPNALAGIDANGRRANRRPAPKSRTSTSNMRSVASSSSSMQQPSYPHIPSADSPPQPLPPLSGRPVLPPRQTTSSRGGGEGVYVIGLDDATGEEQHDNAKTPTSGAIIAPPQRRDAPPASLDIGLPGEPLSGIP
ncbi:hypothetical protein BKA70DRAFT_1432115 [Coprinopsis sp. MPI-PUGE-AT-0042]|nr:hypothetical protein BKA70DRAFT_1432115 [Coprinopsis sp. MPI-PUGE-AT-0042]